MGDSNLNDIDYNDKNRALDPDRLATARIEGSRT